MNEPSTQRITRPVSPVPAAPQQRDSVAETTALIHRSGASDPFDRTAGRKQLAAAYAPIIIPLVLGIALWFVSLGHIDLRGLNDYGLPPALPGFWYAAIALLVIGTAGTLGQKYFHPWIAAGFISGIILVLYGTVPAVSKVPHYAWVYKHIGVVRYIETHGSVDRNIDIYHHWPGFFAASAVFSSLSGRSNPVDYAGWAEVLFVFVDTLLACAVVKVVTHSMRVACGAAALFAATNWVGQSYFSPQALGFCETLAIYLILFQEFSTPELVRLPRWLLLAVKRPLETRPDSAHRGQRWPRRWSIGLVLLLDAAAVVSHQLTPYMIILGVVGLLLLGIIKDWWVLLGIVAITIGYLIPNLTYVEHNFGIFSSLDPFRNAAHSNLYVADPAPGKAFNGAMGRYLTYALWLTAGIGSVRCLRNGSRRFLALVPLAVSPAVLLFGQSYGGEGILRVILFSTPWCAALCFQALAPFSGVWKLYHRAGMIAFFLVLVALFIPAYSGEEEINIIPSAEVAASDYFYSHGKPGSVLVLAAPDFPVRYGADYDRFRGPKSDDDPNLMRTGTFRNRPLGPKDVPLVAGVIRKYSTSGYLVFSTTEITYSSIFHLTPPGQLDSLERAVVESKEFRLWYSNSDTRIYQYTG